MSSDRWLVCVDAGKMTGLALIRWPADGPPVLLASSEEPDWHDAVEWVKHWMDGSSHQVILCLEDFVIAQKVAGQWTIKMNGAIEHEAWLRAIEVSHNNAAVGKGFSTNAKLKALDLWHVGGKGHANDAIRHGLIYMVNNGLRDRRMLA